ncbi:hypothetical protein B0O79_1072 [Flavobacteriaceae bacterium MAR_2009_75]|nr:hypothetical protein B0O79_1072 [Flavobacteriaceae bacterium MAR_2009_75]
MSRKTLRINKHVKLILVLEKPVIVDRFFNFGKYLQKKYKSIDDEVESRTPHIYRLLSRYLLP